MWRWLQNYPHFLERVLRQTPGPRKQEEGKRICIEIIQQVREMEGLAGVHVMAYRQEELVAEVIEERACYRGRSTLVLSAQKHLADCVNKRRQSCPKQFSVL